VTPRDVVGTGEAVPSAPPASAPSGLTPWADRTENIRISDPRALKALAHPARNKILERLQVYGQATATECAAVAGMSPSACSYHRRLLQRYGFVEAGDAEASLLSNSTIVATADELKQIQDQIQRVLKPYLLHDRDQGELPTQERLVHAAIRLTPALSQGAGA